MSDRDKKMIKLLCVLVPALLLAAGYGYGQVRRTKARRAERRQKAQEQSQPSTASRPSDDAGPSEPAAAQGAKAQPSPPPGVQPADKPAIVPAAAFQGVRVEVSTAAQTAREKLPWGRDPFTPPDTEGPVVGHLSDIESPRGKKSVTVSVRIADISAGNSGIHSAVLRYGADEPFDRHTVEGTRPESDNGDGVWTFVFPAPGNRPLGCTVVATDNGRLRNTARSRLFKVTPPPKETVQAQIGGTAVKLTLRGISWSGGKGVALINTDVLAEGEIIQGYEVKKIVKNGVVLTRNEQEVFLQLKE
jgi:hypothetical protein